MFYCLQCSQEKIPAANNLLLKMLQSKQISATTYFYSLNLEYPPPFLYHEKKKLRMIKNHLERLHVQRKNNQLLKAERPFMLIIIGRKKKLFKMICCKIPLFHTFSKSVSEGIVLPFWILLHRNCLRQLALNHLQAYQFFPPRSQVFPTKNKCEHTEGTSEKGPIDLMFPL